VRLKHAEPAVGQLGHVICPNCSGEVYYDVEMSGQMAACPYCDRPLQIPLSPAKKTTRIPANVKEPQPALTMSSKMPVAAADGVGKTAKSTPLDDPWSSLTSDGAVPQRKSTRRTRAIWPYCGVAIVALTAGFTGRPFVWRSDSTVSPTPPPKHLDLSDEAPVSVLRRALWDEDATVKELALDRLDKRGPAAARAMFDLADTLTAKSNPIDVRCKAARVIGRIGAAAKPVVLELAESLKPSEPLQVRQYAAEALGQLRFPANAEALPELLATIQRDTDDPLVRKRCIFSLLKMEDLRQGDTDKVLTQVLNETSVEHALVRYDAARKLAHTLRDKAPDKTADVLLDMLTNKTLVRSDRTDNTLERAANPGRDVRYLAAQALAYLGEKAKKRAEIIEALKEASKDKDPELKRTAANSLKELDVH
jgi:HEAT repeat protein